MNKFLKLHFLCFLACVWASNSQAQNWQHLTNPTHNEMLKGFPVTQPQYDQTMDFGMGRNMTPEGIVRDLDGIKQQGINAVSIEGSFGSPSPYLSPGYMESIKLLVSELKKRGMHLWIIDEGQYPSGFAGGLISKNAPEVRMQGIVVARRINLQDKESITNQALASNVISAVAVNQDTHESKIIDVHSGVLNWTGLPGKWQITLADHRFKTSVTRSA